MTAFSVVVRGFSPAGSGRPKGLHYDCRVAFVLAFIVSFCVVARPVSAQDTFLLVIAGEFNSGKSSFINALLGERVLPEGVTPTTDRINLLRHGPEVTERPLEAYLLERSHPAELVFALRHEGALDAGDVLDRRTRIGLVPRDRERVEPLVESLLADAAGTRPVA